jgi:hypothetical protein
MRARRLGREDPYDQPDPPHVQRRVLKDQLIAIANGQRGSARVLRAKADRAELGGWAHEAQALRDAARGRDAQADQAVSELRRYVGTPS